MLSNPHSAAGQCLAGTQSLEKMQTLALIPMQCLLLCLPLAEEHLLEDFLYRVSGETQADYLTDKLQDFWRQIPESPAKEYAMKHMYYHFAYPTVDEDLSEDSDKLQEYIDYRNSWTYQEEAWAYAQQLYAFRDKLTSI